MGFNCHRRNFVKTAGITTASVLLGAPAVGGGFFNDLFGIYSENKVKGIPNDWVKHAGLSVYQYGNYILESDIFGSDAMLQHADTLIGINRPAKQKIRFYGPDRYIIEDERTLVLHFLKARNGDTRMSFFKAEFERMMYSRKNELFILEAINRKKFVCPNKRLKIVLSGVVSDYARW